MPCLSLRFLQRIFGAVVAHRNTEEWLPSGERLMAGHLCFHVSHIEPNILTNCHHDVKSENIGRKRSMGDAVISK
jgi:hypothetical protein